MVFQQLNWYMFCSAIYRCTIIEELSLFKSILFVILGLGQCAAANPYEQVFQVKNESDRVNTVSILQNAWINATDAEDKKVLN